jgi:hypothetical protein
MRWINRLSALLFGLITLGLIKEALDKHQIIILEKEDDDSLDEEEELKDINDLRPNDYNNAMDLRGAPTHVCPCGCQIWNLKVIFSDNQIATYFLDMECANCGSLATAPTPIDADGI